MARIALTDAELVVTPARREQLAGLRREVRVPRESIRSVAVVADALGAARGLRAPGLHVPHRVKIGTWRGSGKRYVLARRGVPALRVRLSGHDLTEVLVSAPEAADVADRLGVPREHDVTLDAGEVRLAATLTVPPRPGPHPAALIVHGSGPIDRDGNAGARMRLELGPALAVALADAGIATLRYDKRGVGASTGSFLHAGLSDNLADLRAALAWLRARPEVRGDRTFVIGHSEGAYLAAALAGDPALDGIAGIVLLSGAAKTGDETLRWQARRIAPGLPRPVKALLRLMRTDVERQQAKALAKMRASTGEVARLGGRRTNAKWFREMLDLDPRAGLSRIQAPLLAITGDKDLQVDPDDLETIAATVPGPVETWRVPDLTHVLRRDPGTPVLGAYRRLLREPVDAAVLDRVTAWIGERASR